MSYECGRPYLGEVFYCQEKPCEQDPPERAPDGIELGVVLY